MSVFNIIVPVLCVTAFWLTMRVFIREFPRAGGGEKIGFGCLAAAGIAILGWISYAILVTIFEKPPQTGPQLYCTRQGITCDLEGDPAGHPDYDP